MPQEPAGIKGALTGFTAEHAEIAEIPLDGIYTVALRHGFTPIYTVIEG